MPGIEPGRSVRSLVIVSRSEALNLKTKRLAKFLSGRKVKGKGTGKVPVLN